MKNIITTAVLVLILGVMLFITVGIINNSASDIPDCVGYISNGYGKVKFSELSEIKNISINAQTISSGVIYTNENYGDFHNINIIKGGFDGNGALISESMANKLFKSIDIIGAKFDLLGADVTVAGVYKLDKSFLHEISSDGKDYIIVPPQNNEVDYLYIKNISAADEMKLNRLLDGKLDNYRKVNLAESKKIILQFKDILFFVMGFVLFVVLLKKLLKLISELKNNKNIWSYFRITEITAILIIIPIVVSFDLYIPANFFPADKNILNVSHYINLFTDFIRSHNIGSYYFYSSLYFWSFLFVVSLIVVNALVSAKVISKILRVEE